MAEQVNVRNFAEADVKIYGENSAGAIITPEPLLTYCYAEGISIRMMASLQRRAVTGRGRRKLIPRSGGFDDITITVKGFYVRKSQEFQTAEIFNTKKQLQLWFDFNDVSLTADEKETWKFSFARAQDFSLDGQNADPVEFSCTFLSELLLP